MQDSISNDKKKKKIKINFSKCIYTFYRFKIKLNHFYSSKMLPC